MATEHSVIFGANLSQFRASKNMTTQLFSAICDLSTYTIQNYQLGRRVPNFNRFIKICNAHQVSPNLLLHGLYSGPNELNDLDTLEQITNNLPENDQKFLQGLLTYVLDSMIKTRPNLDGASFGTRLRLLRIASGLDVPEFSQRCFVAQSTLRGIESDQHDPSLPLLLSMCNELNVTPEYLVAPALNCVSYSDPRYQYLQPEQFKTLVAIAAYLNNRK